MDDLTDYARLGVSALKVSKRNGRYVFERAGVLYDMSPPGFTDYALDPLVVGADRMILAGLKLKGWVDPQSFLVLYSESYFPMVDVQLTLKEPKFNGWVYSAEGVNMGGLIPGQCAWICPYMVFYFKEPPQRLYLKMELGDEH